MTDPWEFLWEFISSIEDMVHGGLAEEANSRKLLIADRQSGQNVCEQS